MNKNRQNSNPKRRIKMLIRRIRTEKRIIASLEERNYQLVAELNDTKVALANLTNEHNKLMSINYEQAVRLNHTQDDRVKFRTNLDELDMEALSALKSIGSASEGLLNLKKIITHIKTGISDYKQGPVANAASPFSSRNEINLTDSVEVKRNQATVSPMVKGYVISNPTVTLKRLQINEIGGVKELGKPDDTRCELSPIPEETAEAEPIRTRLGRRGQLPQQFTGSASSKLSDFIPEAHAEPVVRLSDVSRLLSNTSWLNVNYTPTKDNSFTSPSTSSASSVSGINIFSAETITLRQRKKGKKSHKVSGVDDLESPSGSCENSKTQNSNVKKMVEDNKDRESRSSNNGLFKTERDCQSISKFMNSGTISDKDKSKQADLTRNSKNTTLLTNSEHVEENVWNYKNSRKRPSNEDAKSNHKGTPNKSSFFEVSSLIPNAGVSVDGIEESLAKESLTQFNANSNEENFNQSKHSIVNSINGSTSKCHDLNILSDNVNNAEKASKYKIETNGNNCTLLSHSNTENIVNNEDTNIIDETKNKYNNTRKQEETEKDEISSSTVIEKASERKSSLSRGAFLLASEVNSVCSSRTFIVRSSNTPNIQEDSVVTCTRVLPEPGIVINETAQGSSAIEAHEEHPVGHESPSLVREVKRPRSTRVKKPSIKILEAVSADLSEGCTQVKKRMSKISRASPKNSKCVADSEFKSTSSLDLENSAAATSKRTSTRVKKIVVYRDEPLTGKEMKKILKKGLRKPR
ncbi:uncharacterized protein isoform X2 [Rhodnius prolixus]|uniref:uncharacterized protein isoform X2 n=1 Tax=Rhodnius prolixus TaxID=13249 RepID=UPI003D18EC6C